jgi:hypothetical protein
MPAGLWRSIHDELPACDSAVRVPQLQLLEADTIRVRDRHQIGERNLLAAYSGGVVAD